MKVMGRQGERDLVRGGELGADATREHGGDREGADLDGQLGADRQAELEDRAQQRTIIAAAIGIGHGTATLPMPWNRMASAAVAERLDAIPAPNGPSAGQAEAGQADLVQRAIAVDEIASAKKLAMFATIVEITIGRVRSLACR